MANELYQVLEVSSQASTDEIKRAYFRLVRKYSPEKEPERFKQIRAAYDTLCDPKARSNYDAVQNYGDQIKELIGQAEQRMEAKEWSQAIPLLKQVLVITPISDAARNLLGLCYIHIENWDFAVKVYRALTKTNEYVPVYWSNFGHVYKQQAESLNDGDSDKAKLYYNARECFKQAVKLESFNSAPYLDIAETYLNESNYSEALAWAERAIGADGKVDYNDFDAMLLICRVHLFSGETQKIEVMTQRIISLLPNNLELRQYAANRFANLGFEVAKIAANLANFDIWRAALQFLKAAMNLEPNNADVIILYEKVEEIVVAIDQYELLTQDSLIIPGFQRLAAFCLADYFDFHDSAPERKSFLNDILTEILASPTSTILASLNKIKFSYPAMYGLNIDLFNRIEQVTCMC